ncbi:BTAD domain-containing putative transcriptional regulator [Streptomyces sp. NPDC001732]
MTHGIDCLPQRPLCAETAHSPVARERSGTTEHVGRLDFRMLGPLEVWAGSQRVEIRGRRQRTVLAMLLLSSDQVVSHDRLIDAVWNGRPPVTCRTQIAICIASLRKAILAAGHTDEVIATTTSGYLLRRTRHRVDAVEFAAAAETARMLGQQGDSGAAVAMLGEALALWRGPALADISSAVIETEAELLEQQRLAAYEQYVTLQLQLGKHREVIPELTALVNDQPLWEHGRAALMLAHYRSGHRPEALRLFRQARSVFREEIGLEPGRVLQDLHMAMLQETTQLLPSADTTVLSAGEVTLPALPPVSAPFVGRERELKALDALVQRGAAGAPAVGLVVGLPGIGKTALALHWARAAAKSFPEGQLYVDLGATGSADVPTVLLKSLGVPDSRIPESFQERIDDVHRYMGNRRMLVILDGVPDDMTAYELVPRTGSCAFLLTSRRVLAVKTTVRFRLSELAPEESVRLLNSLSVNDLSSEGELPVHQLAALCGHFPLALSAASARLAAKPHWRLSHLLTRLQDPRHRLEELYTGAPALRSALDSGRRTLGSSAAELYRRLGLVDTDRIDVRVAEALLDTEEADARGLLEELVDATLLEVADVGPDGWFQYRMPELLALHAAEIAYAETGVTERDAARERVVRSAAGVPGDNRSIPGLRRVC